MLYQLKRAGIGQHDLAGIGQHDLVTRPLLCNAMTILYVIIPVLEYACPVWYTNLNKYLSESLETEQKRALKCIYPGNEYADILCFK